MEKKTFKILIDARLEKVWELLLNQATYPLWTLPFCEGSHFETDWKKGSKALFFNNNNEGMVSIINDNIPNKYMSIKHLGMVKNGIEDMESEKTREWIGSE